MPQKTLLDVFKFQRVFEQGIILKKDHAHAKVETRPPISIHLPKLVSVKGSFGSAVLKNR
jgi:hypothetical protein